MTSFEKVMPADLCPWERKDKKWVKCNFDSGAADTAIPKTEYDGPLEESGTSYRTASGEIVPGYGKGTLSGKDENKVMRKLNGEVTDVHKVLASASAVHKKGFFSLLEEGGGNIIPRSSAIGKELLNYYYALLEKIGTGGLIPLWEEDGVYNFYLERDAQASPSSGGTTPATSHQGPTPMDVSANERAGSASAEPFRRLAGIKLR